MKKILAYCPVIADATSWYRGAGVLNTLRRQYRDKVDVRYAAGPVPWYELTGMDGAFMQRPFTPVCLTIAKTIKNANLPLWVDYDDMVDGLTPDNPVYSNYECAKQNVPELMKMADFVTVSTNALATWAKERGATNALVIPNAWNDYLIPQLRSQPAGPVKRIIWRGCAGHCKDLSDVQDGIIKLANVHPDWEWTFMGWRPWFLEGKGNFKFTGYMELIEYFWWLQSASFNVSIVPLADTPFNRSKSNCSWIETTQAGAVTVAPLWDEWVRDGIVNHYGGMFERVEASMEKHAAREDYWKQSQDFIFGNLLLSKVNKQRMEVIDGF